MHKITIKRNKTFIRVRDFQVGKTTARYNERMMGGSGGGGGGYKTSNFPPGLNSSDFFDVYQIQSHMQMDSGEDVMKLMQTGRGWCGDDIDRLT